MEARYLQTALEESFGRRVFLDSDDLHDLTRLREAVVQSDVLVLLQSARVLERPWCRIEITSTPAARSHQPALSPALRNPIVRVRCHQVPDRDRDGPRPQHPHCQREPHHRRP